MRIVLLTILMKYHSSKGEKIKNRYNQVPHLTQDTNGKVTNSQLDTTNESQEVSPFPAGDLFVILEKPQNLKLLSAANYRWHFMG